MKLFSSISDVTCRKKTLTFDGRPYRMEVWGTSHMGAMNASVPVYFTSFETRNDCERARDLVLDFIERYKKIRNKDVLV